MKYQSKLANWPVMIAAAVSALIYFGTAPVGRAQIAYVGQGATGAGLSGGCAPTAVANGLIYLDNLNGDSIPNLLLNNSGLDTANELIEDMVTSAEDGTTPANRDSGLATYLSAQGTPVSIVGGQAPAALDVTTANILQQNPTAQYMENALAAGDAVEFGQYWGSSSELLDVNNTFGAMGNGGHVLTLLSMTGTTSGNITFEDPTDPQEVDTTTWSTFSAENGTQFIFVTGDTYGQGADDDNANPGNPEDQGAEAYDSFAISDDMVEGVVPEPSTWLAGALMLVPFGASAVRRFRSPRKSE
jgi:hypothetical protein